MKKSILTKGMALVVALILVLSVTMAGCSKEETPQSSTSTNDEVSTSDATQSDADSSDPITLTYAVAGQNEAEMYEQLKVNERYQVDHPNVTIVFEQFKDSEELSQTLKIRIAAGETPDLFNISLKDLALIKDNIVPLNDLSAAQDSIFSEDLKIDGNIYSITRTQYNEYVWYWKSTFAEYNLQVPTTWDEYLTVAETIKDGGKYTPIAMGGKDAWPDYPYNEFMPKLVGNDGNLWNTMATQDDPFSPGKPIYDSYVKVQELYEAQVFGPEPLGIGFDQAKALFLGKEAAMITCADWFLGDVVAGTEGDMSDVGVFLLPVRDTVDEPFYAMAVPGGSTCVGQTDNSEAAKEFLNWLCTDEEVFTEFVTQVGVKSAMSSIPVNAHPVFDQAYDGVDVTYVVDLPGGEDFQLLAAATKLDVKKIGQDMMAGISIDDILPALNESWKESRAELGIE